MTILIRSTLALSVGVWTCCVPLFAAQEREADSWIGKRVMVSRWSVDLKTGGAVVGQARLGEIFEVDQVSGSWLWFKAKSGWIPKKDVVPVNMVIGHFTALVEGSPTADAYAQRAVALMALGRTEAAIADFSASIARDPKNMAVLNDRGNAYRRIGQFDSALADFNTLIERGVRHPTVFTNRGLVWAAKGDLDRALSDYNNALQQAPNFAPAWEAAGSARQEQGNYAKAIDNFQHAIKADANFHLAHNNLAWLLATCADENFRNGAEAVEHATKACELTNFQEGGYLDSLAAALAESGRFEEAATRAKEAIRLVSDAKRDAIASRLKLYEDGKPFHQVSSHQ